MAQPGSALPWGGRGRGFKSRYADSTLFPHSGILSFGPFNISTEDRMDFECAFQCELQNLESRPALTIRLKTRVGDIAEVFDQGYTSIAGYLESKGKEPQGPPFVLYYNMQMDNLEVEFGFPVEEGISGEGNIRSTSTPSGKAAGCLYIGPYEEAEPVYDALIKWIGDNGQEATGVAYEIYLSDPTVTPPEQLKTQVYLLLA